ncbi:MAG: ABC-type branched-chain amino acid uptake system substrate-binding component LivK [Phormidium sp. OSCR]|nr:MAG: ABC-type branched-chain amino acid uptake system substrate-binding component LivK [Phormidium sp. OSCR]
MSAPKPWTCTGKDKNGNPAASGEHPPHTNYGPFCTYGSCTLSREEVVSDKQTGPGGNKFLIPGAIAVGVLALVGGGMALLSPGGDGGGGRGGSEMTPAGGNCLAGEFEGFISEQASQGRFISQGEQVLLTGTQPQNISQKRDAAQSFQNGDWQRALEQYQFAASSDPNDPEAKIYLNNARARLRSDALPRTIAVAIPISSNPDEAREILRGVALSQDQFNNSSPTPDCLMEVALVDVDRSEESIEIAEDLIASSQVLGLIGHGSDEYAQQAVQVYQDNGLTVVSPLTMSVSMSPTGTSVLRVLPYQEGSGQMLDGYLKRSSESLIEHASRELPSPPVVSVFFNSDVAYSRRMKDSFISTLQEKGVSVTPLDILSDISASSGGDASNMIRSATQAGANTAYLALTRGRINSALAIARANAAQNNPLLLLGADELFSPSLLIEGGSAIEGMVLAIPWSWSPEDPFAQQSAAMWQGRVSWRTATAFDATEALAGALKRQNDNEDGGLNRAEVVNRLRQGQPISGVAADFNVFAQGIPLVEAVRGEGGPSGSNYRFDPIDNRETDE